MWFKKSVLKVICHLSNNSKCPILRHQFQQQVLSFFHNINHNHMMHLHTILHIFFYLPLLMHIFHMENQEHHLLNHPKQLLNGQKHHHFHLVTIRLLHMDNSQHLYFVHSLQNYLLAFVVCNIYHNHYHHPIHSHQYLIGQLYRV